MMRVILEIIPKGDESRKFVAGVLTVTNDASGTKEVGNYDLSISGPVQDEPGHALNNEHWERGRLEGFARKRGWWSCVKEALGKLRTDYDEPSQP